MSQHSRKPIIIHATAEEIQAAKQRWDELPDKQSTKLSAGEVVDRMYDAIAELRLKKYSWSDICELIEKDFNLKVAPATLEQYTGRIRRARESQRRSRSRQRKES